MFIPGELEVLVHLVRSVEPRTMIEFGCRDGRTAKIMLNNVTTLDKYIGIDVAFGHQPTLSHQAEETVRHPGTLAQTDSRFELMVRPSGTLGLTKSDLPGADAVFIDGDHSEFAVTSDTKLARQIINPGGIIVWHDYGNEMHGVDDGEIGVKTVLDRLCDIEHLNITSVLGTWLAFLRA